MPRLKDRNQQIPGGFKYREPAINWDSTQQLPMMPSLRVLAHGLIAARLGNPAILNANDWPTDLDVVEMELDHYNAQICADHGWNSFITLQGGEERPFPPLAPTLLRSARNVAVGAEINAAMLFGTEGPVSKETAEKRATVCVTCPQNGKGDWTTYFTAPAAAVIRRTIEFVRGQNLTTSQDASLGTCTSCGCPLRSKIWAQLDHLKASSTPEDRATLDPRCWVLCESEPS